MSIAISRIDAKQWCTEHEYELLELEKTTTSETDDDDEDDENSHRKQKIEKKTKESEKRKFRNKKFYPLFLFYFLFTLVYQDVYGVPRLLQTLHLQQWPNMNLKGKEKLFRGVLLMVRDYPIF